MSRAEKAALNAYPGKVAVLNEDGSESIYEDSVIDNERRHLFIKGYKQAEKEIIALIESRIGEILGDAQPKPTLRIELQELIKQIEES